MDYNSKIVMLKGADGADIKEIKKTSTSGLTDTYTITLSDGRKFDFTVTNGKWISSISKAGSRGLVDTYNVNYNDGTTSTFTVTNGEGLQNRQIDGRNLIIKRDLKNGWLSGGVGEFGADPDYECTDYIPLKSGEIVTVSWRKVNVIDEPWLGIFFFNSDKTCILDDKWITQENPTITTKTAPDQCAYLRVYWKGTKDEKVKVELGNMATDWTPAPEDLPDTSITNSDIDTILNS